MESNYRDQKPYKSGFSSNYRQDNYPPNHSQYRGNRGGSQHYRGSSNYHNSNNRNDNNQYRNSDRQRYGSPGRVDDQRIQPRQDDQLPQFQKDFYVEDDLIKNRSEEDNAQYTSGRFIKTSGKNCPRPVQTFEESGLPPYLKEQLKENPNFSAPTAIQSQAWPVALTGRDLIGIAQTGSGKTLAFILPAIVHVMAQPTIQRGDGPIVLVMAPTRELCMQIEQEANKFASVCQLSTLAVYGGVPKYQQASALSRGVEIMIACPGRLLDFLESRTTNLRRVTYLVLDEADRMLDMGFEKDIKKVIDYIRYPNRQTLMYSATWPKEIQSLANEYCCIAPIHITIGDQRGFDGLTGNSNIKQIIHVVPGYEKKAYFINLLIKLIGASQVGGTQKALKIIVFCQMKKGVDELDRLLQYDRNLHRAISFESKAIHGDKDQFTRDSIYAKFKAPLTPDQTTSNILIATDVASRGLDVKDIDLVINFDMPPGGLDNYVHRIGRTGRAGRQGAAHSFVTKLDYNIIPDLVKFLKQTDQEISRDLTDLKNEAYGAKQTHHRQKVAKTGFGVGKISFGVQSQSISMNNDQYQKQPYNGYNAQGYPPSGEQMVSSSQVGNPYDRYQPNYPARGQPQGEYRDYNQGPQQSYQNKRDRKYDDHAQVSSMHQIPQEQGFSQKDFKNELFGTRAPYENQRDYGDKDRIFIEAPPKPEVKIPSAPAYDSQVELAGPITPAIIKLNGKSISFNQPSDTIQPPAKIQKVHSSQGFNPEVQGEQRPRDNQVSDGPHNGQDHSQNRMMWGPKK